MTGTKGGSGAADLGLNKVCADAPGTLPDGRSPGCRSDLWMPNGSVQGRVLGINTFG